MWEMWELTEGGSSPYRMLQACAVSVPAKGAGHPTFHSDNGLEGMSMSFWR